MPRLRPHLLLLLPTLGLLACPPKGEDTDSGGGETGVLNEAPALTIDSPDDGDAFEGGSGITVAGFVADDTDAPGSVLVTISSDVSGTLASPMPDASGIFSATVDLAVGAHTLTVTATDGEGASSTATVSVTVTDPAVDDPPTAPVVHIEPGDPITGQGLAVVIDEPSVDPEGAQVSYTYTWTVDGEVYGQGDTVVPDGVTARGQVWSVSVAASDGALESAPGSDDTQIGNAPPVAAGVAITPSAASVGDELSCEATGLSDADGDPVEVTYGWLVDGVEAASGTTLPGGVARSGQEVVCVATLSDGFDTAEVRSASVVIDNSAPSAPVVEITGSADTDDLVCAVVTDAVDPDGDTLTYAYAWTRDGVATGTTAATVAAADTHRDETWTCAVTATDGSGTAGPAGSASVTVGIAWSGVESASDADVTIDGAAAGDAFGKTVALVGDFTGDGRSELLVTANGANTSKGKVYLFDGATLSGSLTAADAVASWAGSYASGQLGGFRAVAAPGDMDADGTPDLLFAAPTASANGTNSGEVYLVYGASGWTTDMDPATSASFRVRGSTGDKAGARLTAGDLDGDGWSDLVVASPAASDVGRSTGSVTMFMGTGTQLSGEATFADADHHLSGDAQSDELGWTLKFVGDVDADGYEDLFTAAMYADENGSESGTGGLLLGGVALSGGSHTLSSVSDALFHGDAAGDRMGYDVAGGVDIDQDGVDDLVIGAYTDDDGATANTGAVWVFLGRTRWASEYAPSDADHGIYGSAANEYFGSSIASPGDLDSDGTNDLLFGASGAAPTGLSGQGAAWVLLGPDGLTPSTSSSISWSACGEAASDSFGDAVGFGRGDANGDGVEDFAVGAQGQDTAGSAAGRVYLWWGR